MSSRPSPALSCNLYPNPDILIGMIAIADFHNDLLGYLCIEKTRTPYDRAPRSGLLQLQAGHVRLMALAIGWVTEKGSSRYCELQCNCYSELLQQHSDAFVLLKKEPDLSQPLIHLVLAIENASVLVEEEEPLSKAFARLERIVRTFGHPLYVGLTWNGENRFGGGVGSSAGLKEDGKELLLHLSGSGTAVDLSHTSDRLAYEILHFIDQRGLSLPIIASHSNFRAVVDNPRNLPDELAKEIIERRGVIGLNLFAPFLGTPDQLIQQVAHALSLGGEEALLFGADFFNENDGLQILARYPNADLFHTKYPDSSAFPSILIELKEKLHLSEEQLQRIAHGNALHYLKSWAKSE